MAAMYQTDKCATLLWFRSRQKLKIATLLPVAHECYSKTKSAHALWSTGPMAQAVSHSALVLTGIAVLPLRDLSYGYKATVHSNFAVYTWVLFFWTRR